MQSEKIKNILQHAYYTVPFYRNVIVNKDIDLSCISTLPVICKKDIVESEYSLLSEDVIKNTEQLIELHTSGTTGIQPRVY